MKVFSINMWGLRWPLGEDDAERFKTLRDVLRSSDYDFVLLQEVWYKSQYDAVRGSMPYITDFEAINSGCSGRFLLPIGCSGLVILSRHPIEFAEIRPFSVGGSFWNFDGEVFVRKGIARARSRWNGYSVDIFTTHLVSYTNNPNYDNTMYRFQQAAETSKAIRDSDADVKLFGGDLNALPYLSERQPYRILRTVAADSLTDVFDEDSSFHPFFSTYGNPKNTYKGTAIPERIDYLMYSSSPAVKMRSLRFIMPFLMGKDKEGNAMSVSDHEGLYAEFLVERHAHHPSHAHPHYPSYPPHSIHDSYRNNNSKKSYHKKKKNVGGLLSKPLYTKYNKHNHNHHKTAKRSTPRVPTAEVITTETPWPSSSPSSPSSSQNEASSGDAGAFFPDKSAAAKTKAKVQIVYRKSVVEYSHKPLQIPQPTTETSSKNDDEDSTSSSHYFLSSDDNWSLPSSSSVNKNVSDAKSYGERLAPIYYQHSSAPILQDVENGLH